MSGRLAHAIVKTLDRAVVLLGRAPKRAAHLRTGTSGEELAYFHLRTIGYTIVARNFRSFEVYLVVTGLYLAMCLAFQAAFAAIHRMLFARWGA